MPPPCPHLPTSIPPPLEGTSASYLSSLLRAQAYWLNAKPAQAILQLNKALSADLSTTATILRSWPLPYPALAWILENSAAGTHGFLGNPVRHFQHLATRTRRLHNETRIARAWKCFHIAQRTLQGKGHFPLDGRQIAREGIFIPSEKFA